jgi:hypothetical protein
VLSHVLGNGLFYISVQVKNLVFPRLKPGWHGIKTKTVKHGNLPGDAHAPRLVKKAWPVSAGE